MKGSLFDELPAIAPLDFFCLEVDIEYAERFLSRRALNQKYLLPSTSELLGEESFADFYLAWNDEQLLVQVFVSKPFEEVDFTDFSRGDSLEIFIDTRDIKGSVFTSRFCHHFLIFPVESQGARVRELTHFRSEDTHPLCAPSDIQVDVDMHKSSYEMRITFPKEILHGYDPKLFQRLGFTYRLNRYRGNPQHFALSSQDYSIAQMPGAWASVLLK